MEKFVKSNYLNLGHEEKQVNVQIATPREAFDGMGNIKSIHELFDLETLFDDIDDSPELQKAKKQLEILLKTPLDLGLTDSLENQPAPIKNLVEKLIPNAKNQYTFKEWMGQFANIYKGLMEDKTVYKDLRRHSIEQLNLVGKYNIDIEKFDFDKDFRNTPFQQSFLEYVEQSLSYNKSLEKQKRFHFFTTAFNSLNILGLDKESNKKAKLANTMNDGQHAFYAAHCDYFVSDDEGLLLKTRVLYKLLGIETKVLSVKDFAKSISQISGHIDKDIKSYLEFLTYELQNALVVDSKPSLRYNRQYTVFKTNNLHFGYFNRFEKINDNDAGEFYVFYKESKNYSAFVSYEEFEAVTNKVVQIFGIDNNFKKEFSDKDLEEFQKGNWLGRQWSFDNFNFGLEINEGTRKFSFVIGLNNK